MTKVITYGTYDLLHEGHIRLLKRAKALGDYLIVGITADDFDKTRGKINVQQSLVERIEAVKSTGIADEIIVEEYVGQKIDDIQKYGIDIFTVGSDWKGKFDYLNEFCNVVYLPRTEGISSSEIRSEKRKTKIGIIGNSSVAQKFAKECQFVNGVELVGVCAKDTKNLKTDFENVQFFTNNILELFDKVDAIYINSRPELHFQQAKLALENKKHVICESPIALKKSECKQLMELAKQNHCILFEGIKTAYSTAYSRLRLMIKSGTIGDVVSVESTCTSLKNFTQKDTVENDDINWNSICDWGPTALLPVFQLLGTNYVSTSLISKFWDKEKTFDKFSKIDFVFQNAVASIKVGNGIKSEGSLIISGTEGYIYVPAPWWKTDYFEVRFENQNNNKRYFYQLDGEGIRYEIVAFAKAIECGNEKNNFIDSETSLEISAIIENFYNKKLIEI